MRIKNKFRSRTITPDEEDKPFMFESLVFIILMVICAAGLIYGMVRLFMDISGSITVSQLP